MADAVALQSEIEAVLGACERAWCVHLTCHPLGGALRDAQGASVIPAHRHYHRAPACMRVKRSGGNQACIDFHHHDRLPRALADGEAPVWRRCHGGIDELVVPVRCGGRLEALLQLQPRGGRRLASPAAVAGLAAAAALLSGWLAHLAARLAEARAVGGDQRLTRINSFLAAHLAEDPGLDALAGALGLSPERARHVVRELTGMSFRALKDHHRLAAARRLLGLGFQPIRTVARQCGCADPAWFGRWFRRRTGVTPGVWRRSAREA